MEPIETRVLRVGREWIVRVDSEDSRPRAGVRCHHSSDRPRVGECVEKLTCSGLTDGRDGNVRSVLEE